MGKALEFKQKWLNESADLVEEFNSTVGKWLEDAEGISFKFPGYKLSDTATAILELIFDNYINSRLYTEAHINNTLDELMVIFDMPASCRTDDLNDFVAALEDITWWNA